MAYPTVSAPYGLQARNEIGGLPYAGSTRMIPIAAGYATNLFYGDIVQLSGGTAVANSYTAATSPTTPIAGTIGVFVGCEYTQPVTNQKQRAKKEWYKRIRNRNSSYIIIRTKRKRSKRRRITIINSNLCELNVGVVKLDNTR